MNSFSTRIRDIKSGFALAMALAAFAAFAPDARGQGTNAPAAKPFTRAEDVVYAPDVNGAALVMDIFTPTGPANGIGIVDVVSGSWHSDRGKLKDHEAAGMYKTFCGRGYTVFAARPGSVTKFCGAEMDQHVKRAIRWVKYHAAEYKIDPNKIGLTGASAGGHLASLASVTAEDGKGDAKDPVNTFSSAVAATAVFFPPTDFTRWGKDPATANAGMAMMMAKGQLRGLFFEAGDNKAKTDDEVIEAMKRISPALHVTASAPPFLIYHGTADPLVPTSQSEIFVKALKDAGVDAELRIKQGGGHPWPTINEEVAKIADWFDEKLVAKK